MKTKAIRGGFDAGADVKQTKQTKLGRQAGATDCTSGSISIPHPALALALAIS
jgi:hypothetical protein